MHAKLPIFSEEFLLKIARGMKSLLSLFSRKKKNLVALLNESSGPQASCKEPGRFMKTTLHPGTAGFSRDCLAPRLPITSDTRYCCLTLRLHAKSHLNGIDLFHGHLGIWAIRVEQLNCRMNINSGRVIAWILPGSQTSWLYHILSDGTLW